MCFAKSILEKIRQLKFLHSLMHDNIFVFLRWSSRTWWHFCGNIYIWNIIRMMTFLRDMFLVSYLHSFPPIEFYHLNAVFLHSCVMCMKNGFKERRFSNIFSLIIFVNLKNFFCTNFDYFIYHNNFKWQKVYYADYESNFESASFLKSFYPTLLT